MPPKFVPRQRKHKRRERSSHGGGGGGGGGGTIDSNELELPSSNRELHDSKALSPRTEIVVDQPQISRQKQKRLEKYIEKKLRKEENIDLIKKLGSAKTDTSLFQSSRNLGSGRTTRRGDCVLVSEGLKTPQGPNSQYFDRLSDSLLEDSDSSEPPKDEFFPPLPGVSKVSSATTFGFGLKRPLKRDEEGNPILRKRTRVGGKEPRASQTALTIEHSTPGASTNHALCEDSVHGNYYSLGPLRHPTSCGGAECGPMRASPRVSKEEQSDGDMSAQDLCTVFHSQSGVRSDDDNGWERRSTRFRQYAAPRHPTEIVEQMREYQRGDLKTVTQEPRALVTPLLPPDIHTSPSKPPGKPFHVDVERSPEIQASRIALPILAEEQQIMEAIQRNPIVVLWGATGSGKSTQVPQFLYEAGYGNPHSSTPGMIGVTQPRRVAAVSTANRVSTEMGDVPDKVSYQIRFDSTVGKKTAIKYMTDGILLREITHDFALLRYSAIIIDEAHERSTNTDILVGMLSRIVELRRTLASDGSSVRPLKLVIMSATLRVADFTKNANLFLTGPPPLVQAEGRQHPVKIHFSRRTQRDYCEEMFQKVCRGHKKLPPGGFLVFLTGESEIIAFINKLRTTFPTKQNLSRENELLDFAASDAPLEAEDLPDCSKVEDPGSRIDFEGEESTGDEDTADEEFKMGGEALLSRSIHVLPLYSKLPTYKQLRVFQPTPESSRLIIVATNVAETSLTIPGIRYVFDAGRAKEKQYNHSTGVQRFEIDWISKASASQRAGRAGRMGPGHCYRLYSSAVYEREFKDHTEPELLRTPIEGVVLQLKSMNIQNVTKFPFPSPMDPRHISKAERLLKYLGAVDAQDHLTRTGAAMTVYPIAPRLSKLLTLGNQHDCMYLTTALVAALANPDLIMLDDQKNPSLLTGNLVAQADADVDHLVGETHVDQSRKSKAMRDALFTRFDTRSDGVKLLSVFIACYYAQRNHELESFCRKFSLRAKAFEEALQLWEQLTKMSSASVGIPDNHSRDVLDAIRPSQGATLRQMLAVAFIDQIAIRADLSPDPPEISRRPQRATDVPYFALFPTHEGTAQDLEDKAIYIHPSSLLANVTPKELPQYIVYSHLQRAATNSISSVKKTKTRMHPLTPVGAKVLASMSNGHPLFELSKPIGAIESVPGRPDERMCWVIPSIIGDKGRKGWPLAAQKILEKRNERGVWVRTGSVANGRVPVPGNAVSLEQ